MGHFWASRATEKISLTLYIGRDDAKMEGPLYEHTVINPLDLF